MNNNYYMLINWPLTGSSHWHGHDCPFYWLKIKHGPKDCSSWPTPEHPVKQFETIQHKIHESISGVNILYNFKATFHKKFTFFLPYKSRCLKRSVVSSWVFRPRAMTDRSEVTTDMSTVSSNSSSSVSELGLIFNPIML